MCIFPFLAGKGKIVVLMFGRGWVVIVVGGWCSGCGVVGSGVVGEWGGWGVGCLG